MKQEKEHINLGLTSGQLIAEFIDALNEEIEAVKKGKGGSAVQVFDGRFIRENSGIYVYSFMVESFIATVDDAPIEIQIGDSHYQGQIIQAQGLEIIIGLEDNLGQSIPQARLIINLYFLYEMLKKKYESIRDNGDSEDFALANSVFENKVAKTQKPFTYPTLEAHPKNNPNDSQMEAIKLSQRLNVTFVWGPPGTGKTLSLARIVESFIKRDKRVLVVSHANAAVDEAAEDIAEILKTTEYYNRGQIIRLGNYQKDTLETDYPLVILEKIADKLGSSLKLEKDHLKRQSNEMENNLVQINSLQELIQERDVLSIQIKQLHSGYVSSKKEMDKVRETSNQRQIHQKELQTKLQRALSANALKRLFLGLDPAKIKHEMDQVAIELDAIGRQIHELELRSTHIKNQETETDTRFYDVKQIIASSLNKLKISESDLHLKRKELTAERDRILSRINEIQKELDEIQKRILLEGKVICTTLTKTFSSKDLPDEPFDILVVDEASMAPMPYIYWALSRCQENAVIVGDFLQLPPICVADENMAQKWLGRSIYGHLNIDNIDMAKKDLRVCLLKIQYRMNPLISGISNGLFYEHLLSDHPNTKKHIISEGLSKSPLTLIDTTSASPWCSRLKSGSRFNVYNALVSATIAEKALRNINSNGCKIGIICPYKVQARLIGKILKDKNLDREVRVSTIHRFQGSEADIIIFDSVESPGVKVTSMIDDMRNDSDAPLLLNVAMTRAKSKIFLVGNLKYLKKELSPETVFYKIIYEFEKNGEYVDCSKIVDSYFVRDFESWIKRILVSSNTGIKEGFEGSLFSEKAFFPVFFADLQTAEEEIIILSPFISLNRSGQFIDLFRILIQKRVKIRIFTKPVNEQTGSFSMNSEEVIQQLRAIGAEVVERRRMHQKVAIIDRSIAWEGSLNILSHRDSEEQMRRLPFATAVNELIRLCELEGSISGNGGNAVESLKTFEKCPECEQEMLIRVSKYGPFLSCPDRSCPGKRNINKWDKIRTHTLCPECGKAMFLRIGARGGFLGCSGYPDCKKTMPIR